MKESFPLYNQGDLVDIEKRLSKKDKDILEQFLRKCSITAGAEKVKKIKRHLIQFYDITEKGFDEQDKNSIEAFLVLLNKSKRSVWTKNEMKGYLKKFLKWFYKDYELVEDIKREFTNIANKVNENNLITEQDVKKMLNSAENNKERAYLSLMFEIGARPQEVLSLRWKDIKFLEGYANVLLFSNKTKRSREYPVVESGEELYKWKQTYFFPDVKPQDLVFPSRYRNKQMTTNGANKLLRRLSVKAGIDKDVWNYLLRHTRATRLYEELPSPIVEKLMGHQNMSKTYAHISNKKTREAILTKLKKLDKLDSKKAKELEGEIEKLKKDRKRVYDEIEDLKQYLLGEIKKQKR